MKLAFLVGGAVGYVLGARAGRERYESIVRTARKVSGSQTVQSTAGVLQAQASDAVVKLRHGVGKILTHEETDEVRDRTTNGATGGLQGE